MVSCKGDFLDAKPSTAIVTPQSLPELEGLLENVDVLNRFSPALSQLASDEYYFVNVNDWNATNTLTERNSYIWAKDIFQGEIAIRDWDYPNRAVFYCNNVLESLEKIKQETKEVQRWNECKGKALFFRAYAWFELLRNFSPVYKESTADSDLGIPLRTEAAIDYVVQRASVRESFAKVLTDLMEAEQLLPAAVPSFNKNRPSKAAVHALLARIYLYMGDYRLAEVSAGTALDLHDRLIDYNLVSQTSVTPFPIDNEETIFSMQSVVNVYSTLATINSNTAIEPDSLLLDLYDGNDLRRVLFFDKTPVGTISIKRGYFGSIYPYAGLATDELFLILAECMARRNQVEEALAQLKKLWSKRFKNGEFIFVPPSNADEALALVLTERRKELFWRTLRWYDLKRLNRDGANIKLTRILDGQIFELPPNDRRYVFPIPDDEIAYSNIQQNER